VGKKAKKKNRLGICGQSCFRPTLLGVMIIECGTVLTISQVLVLSLNGRVIAVEARGRMAKNKKAAVRLDDFSGSDRRLCPMCVVTRLGFFLFTSTDRGLK